VRSVVAALLLLLLATAATATATAMMIVALAPMISHHAMILSARPTIRRPSTRIGKTYFLRYDAATAMFSFAAAAAAAAAVLSTTAAASGMIVSRGGYGIAFTAVGIIGVGIHIVVSSL